MNMEDGRMVEINHELAKRFMKSEFKDNVFHTGEVVEIVGKVGTYRVASFGKHRITLDVLPVQK